MKIGIIGLGRMGAAIAERALRGGHDVVGYDVNQETCKQAQEQGVSLAASIEDVAKTTDVIWLMIPAGSLVDATLTTLVPCMKAGTIVVDGGNCNYQDSMRRAKMLAQKNIFFLDCGTSGGLQGRELGFSLMVGGDRAAYEKVLPLFMSIAAKDGVEHVGPSGAGHYVKMVHNGIEYALLQAYAEGFHLIKEGSFKDAHLNLEAISRVWNNGAVIRSWILTLADDIFERDQNFSNISGAIEESGTGRWTVEEAHKNNIPVRVIEESLTIREWSRKTGGNYATKLVALLRHAFGGHAVKKIKKEADENN